MRGCGRGSMRVFWISLPSRSFQFVFHRRIPPTQSSSSSSSTIGDAATSGCWCWGVFLQLFSPEKVNRYMKRHSTHQWLLSFDRLYFSVAEFIAIKEILSTRCACSFIERIVFLRTNFLQKWVDFPALMVTPRRGWQRPSRPVRSSREN